MRNCEVDVSAGREHESIRAADANDLDALLPLVAAYRAFYGQAGDTAAERAFLQAHLERQTSTVFIATAQTRAVGFVQLFRTFSTVHLGEALILEDLYVAEDSRGQGLATRLLAASVEYARRRGAVGMFLETAFDNRAAQRVYERNGWTREGRFLKFNAPL